MRVVAAGTVGRVDQRPRHPEVNQQNLTALESDNYILAPPSHRGDAQALQASRDKDRVLRPRQPRVEDLDALEPPPLEHRRDPAPDGLDLG
jgi:hypothetical protein